MRPTQMKRARFLGYLLAAGATLPLALSALFSYEQRVDTVRRGEVEAGYNAEILQKHAEGVLHAQRGLIDLVDLKLAAAPPEAWNAAELHRFLRERVLTEEGANSISLLDPSGRVRVTSLDANAPVVDASDRDFFLRAMRSRGVVVGARVVGRLSGEPLFFVARHRQPGGGVTAVAMRPAFFEDAFRAAAGTRGKQVGIALLREDGEVLARFPPLEGSVRLGPETGFMQHGLGRAAASYRSVAQVDGTERQYAVRRLSGFPLYVSYGVDMGAVLRPWRDDLLLNSALAAMASLLLGWMSWLALRQARRDVLNEQWLRQEVAERTAEAERRAREAEAAARERTAALETAERANAAKSHFLAAASHDLRQPVQALRLYLEVLTGDASPHLRTAALANASAALGGLEELLSALLDVSVLEAGTLTPEREPVPLSEVLAALERQFRSQAVRKGLRFTVVNSSACLLTDPVLLHRILANLVGNALKYTSTGRILIGARRCGAEAVRIEVWDTGPGIPADKIGVVFEDFQQLDNPERDRRRGLGLGLGIVRRTAELLGHDLSVRTVEGRGSVFSVAVPLAQAVRHRAA